MDYIFPMVFANAESNELTELLGVFAGMAFLGTVIWVVATIMKEGAEKERVSAIVNRQASNGKRLEKERSNGYDRELERLKKEYESVFNEVLTEAKLKLSELTLNAQSTLGQVSRAYGRNASNRERDGAEAVSAQFTQACERQWMHLKNQLGYVGVTDIEPQLRLLLSAHELIEQYHGDGSEDCVEMNPLTARMQEAQSLFGCLPRERMGRFQMESIEAVDPYIYAFEHFVREWAGDASMRIVSTVRMKGEYGLSINDTDFKPRLVRLKNVIDTVSKLCERMQSNSKQVGEEEIAFNQIVFGGAVLSIVANLQDWFPELGVPKSSNVETVTATIVASD